MPAEILDPARAIQLGELVIATGAEASPIDLLAGVLLASNETKDTGIMEG